jgi:hypothetical protein
VMRKFSAKPASHCCLTGKRSPRPLRVGVNRW